MHGPGAKGRLEKPLEFLHSFFMYSICLIPVFVSLYVDGPRGPPNHHMGLPPEHQGSDGGSQYWGEDGGYQEGWRRPGQDFHGDPRGHRGGSGGQWENQERFPSHDDDYERSIKLFRGVSGLRL